MHPAILSLRIASAFTLICALAACGGGDSGGTPAAAGASATGLAASGTGTGTGSQKTDAAPAAVAADSAEVHYAP